MTKNRKAIFAAALMAPMFVLATPALASAADDGQDFRSTQTSTTRDGVTRTSTDSCMGTDGEASFQRTTQTANANGRTIRTVDSGNAACDSGSVQAASAGGDASNADAQNFRRSQTSTTRDGVSHSSAGSCTDSDGDVAFEGSRQSANANGRTSRTVTSGDASCNGSAQASSSDAAKQVGAAKASDAADNAAESAPLMVVPNPLSR